VGSIPIHSRFRVLNTLSFTLALCRILRHSRGFERFSNRAAGIPFACPSTLNRHRLAPDCAPLVLLLGQQGMPTQGYMYSPPGCESLVAKYHEAVMVKPRKDVVMVSKRSYLLIVMLVSWTQHVTAQDNVQLSPPSGYAPSASVDRELSQTQIRQLIERLASPSELEWKTTQKQLIEAGRAPAFELFKASKDENELLATRALETLKALSKSDVQLLDATGHPLGHILVEFFQLDPRSGKLSETPFATSASDNVSGIVVPELQVGHGVAMRVRLSDYGSTIITRVPPARIWHLKQEHRGRDFRRLYLPIVTPDSQRVTQALQGVVQDESGKPVAGAEILCRHIDSPGEGYVRGIEPLSSIVTGDDGRFRLSLVKLTDNNGVARFHVEKNAAITFSAWSPNLFPMYEHEYFQNRIDVKTGNAPPERPFQIQLTADQMKILSELPPSRHPSGTGDRP
jgi:hypothetical protein